MGDKISALFSLMLIPIMYLSPFVILFFILTQFKHMGSPDTQAQYGSLYEGLKYGNRMQVFCNFIFTSRRLILILFAVYLGDYPSF